MDLFGGFNTMRALTYTSSIPMVLRLLRDYDYDDFRVRLRPRRGAEPGRGGPAGLPERGADPAEPGVRGRPGHPTGAAGGDLPQGRRGHRPVPGGQGTPSPTPRSTCWSERTGGG